MRARIGVGMAMGVVLLAAACAPAEILPANVTYVPDPVVSREPVPSPPDDPVPSVVWPLTGLDAEGADPAELAKMAIAVKIPNDSSHSRPQKSLEYADIVFEEYVEAGIPRLVAVFQTQHPADVGPIRSMREMDPNIVGSFGGPLVFSGANPHVMSYAKGTGQLLIADDLGSDAMFRTKDRVAPYNLHVNLQEVAVEAGPVGPPGQQFQYAYPAELATAFVEGTPANLISLRFSKYGEPKWDWDPATGLWKRREFEDPDITVDGNQISATNVIVLFVTINMNHSLPVSQMIVSGSPGYVATGGKYIPILWTKSDRTSGYVITTTDGRPVTLAAGNTWVELIPNGGVATGKAEFS